MSDVLLSNWLEGIVFVSSMCCSVTGLCFDVCFGFSLPLDMMLLSVLVASVSYDQDISVFLQIHVISFDLC